MKVFVAYWGEPCEGIAVLGIYSNKEAANERVGKWMKECPYYVSYCHFGVYEETVKSVCDYEIEEEI